MMNYTKTIKEDAKAGLVLFLVAVPLSIGVAVASGVTPFSGLLGAIIGGVVIGLISKSQTSVTGPDAGLAAVVVASISQLGAFEAFLMALVIAGGIQILFGVLRLGMIANYFPSSVIKGLLASIGILFIMKWIPHFVGYDKENKEVLAVFSNIDTYKFEHLIMILKNSHLGATIIGAVSLATIIFWERVRFLKKSFIPVALVVIIIGATLNQIFNYFPGLILGGNHLVSVPVSSSVNEFILNFKTPDFSKIGDSQVWTVALSIAIIASLTTLLNVEAVDKLDRHSRNTPQSRELIAQGIGNSLLGLIGGIPVNAAVIRGSLNIQVGAETKMSTIIHGALVFVFVAFLPGLLNLIPLSTLAAILIVSGYKLAKPKFLIDAYKQGLAQFLPFLVTIVAILSTNLLLGIVIGLGLGMLYVFLKDIRSSLKVTNEKQYHEDVARINLPQFASFMHKKKMRDLLNAVPRNSKIMIDASGTRYIDGDIIEVISNFKNIMAPEKNISLSLTGFDSKYGFDGEIKHATVMTKDLQNLLTPKEVLQILQEGNRRFISGASIQKDLTQQMMVTSTDGQHPLAVVLSCVDSSTASELIFDLGVGDIFSIKIAGNLVNEDVIASMEYSCKVAGAKLIVVLGHSDCSAIKAACDHLQMGNFNVLLDKMRPALEAEYATTSNRNSSNPLFVKNVTRLNVHHNIFHIADNSEILSEMLDKGEVGIVGAIFDGKTGEVKFTPMFKKQVIEVN